MVDHCSLTQVENVDINVSLKRAGGKFMITLVAFRWVPPFAQGLVRDLRVRWALEEAGLPYRERLLAQGEQASPEHRALPRALGEMMEKGTPEQVARVTKAMLAMKKFDIAALEKAYKR
jgi:hypothetical protein